MSSHRLPPPESTSTQQPATDQQSKSLGLSPAQVTGSALAAMSGAFLASYLGTAGTLIGAFVGSVIATVGAAVYTHSLRRTSQAVKQAAVVVRQVPLITGAIPRPHHQEAASEGPVPDPNAPDPNAPESPEPPDEAERPARSGGRFDLPWVKVTLATAAVLVAALGGITAVEAITGKPISALLGRDDGKGTTVGRVVGNDGSQRSSDEQDQEPSRQVTPSDEAKPSEEPTEEPTDEATQPADPEPSPTVPEPTPTADPTAPADPEGAANPGDSGDSGDSGDPGDPGDPGPEAGPPPSDQPTP